MKRMVLNYAEHNEDGEQFLEDSRLDANINRSMQVVRQAQHGHRPSGKGGGRDRPRAAILTMAAGAGRGGRGRGGGGAVGSSGGGGRGGAVLRQNPRAILLQNPVRAPAPAPRPESSGVRVTGQSLGEALKGSGLDR